MNALPFKTTFEYGGELELICTAFALVCNVLYQLGCNLEKPGRVANAVKSSTRVQRVAVLLLAGRVNCYLHFVIVCILTAGSVCIL